LVEGVWGREGEWIEDVSGERLGVEGGRREGWFWLGWAGAPLEMKESYGQGKLFDWLWLWLWPGHSKRKEHIL
jgi:hypothetical protein